mmetsp:Transcript_39170/g.77011  ORF Transcript_39170/g.77011 Transcript_39170/m.77011 type:complete len:284 (+) Transcript_39170:437-1288(+)
MASATEEQMGGCRNPPYQMNAQLRSSLLCKRSSFCGSFCNSFCCIFRAHEVTTRVHRTLHAFTASPDAFFQNLISCLDLEKFLVCNLKVVRVLVWVPNQGHLLVGVFDRLQTGKPPGVKAQHLVQRRKTINPTPFTHLFVPFSGFSHFLCMLLLFDFFDFSFFFQLLCIGRTLGPFMTHFLANGTNNLWAVTGIVTFLFTVHAYFCHFELMFVRLHCIFDRFFFVIHSPSFCLVGEFFALKHSLFILKFGFLCLAEVFFSLFIVRSHKSLQWIYFFLFHLLLS